jgi:hypothetical protein
LWFYGIAKERKKLNILGLVPARANFLKRFNNSGSSCGFTALQKREKKLNILGLVPSLGKFFKKTLQFGE